MHCHVHWSPGCLCFARSDWPPQLLKPLHDGCNRSLGSQAEPHGGSFWPHEAEDGCWKVHRDLKASIVLCLFELTLHRHAAV